MEEDVKKKEMNDGELIAAWSDKIQKAPKKVNDYLTSLHVTTGWKIYIVITGIFNIIYFYPIVALILDAMNPNPAGLLLLAFIPFYMTAPFLGIISVISVLLFMRKFHPQGREKQIFVIFSCYWLLLFIMVGFLFLKEYIRN